MVGILIIQEDIINVLQYIPEAKLIEIYDLIHEVRKELDLDNNRVYINTELDK
ncbi:MAG: hypothetical protein Q7U38_09520 [Methylobacter sp.]|nr:hypothetical protein [Methylobacter sp.]MDP2098990.1 hypothetical protein [Methylobacter sp.]MDZ4220902.1 hypothetical protein [Methylobacter sp.]